jgi:hypothetical protein
VAEALGRLAEADVAFDPGQVGFLGGVGVAEDTELFAHLIEELHGGAFLKV